MVIHALWGQKADSMLQKPPTKPPRLARRSSIPALAPSAEMESHSRHPTASSTPSESPPPKPPRNRLVQSIAAAAAHALKDGVLRPTSLVIRRQSSNNLPQADTRPQTWCNTPISSSLSTSLLWSTLSASSLETALHASPLHTCTDGLTRPPSVNDLHPRDVKAVICLGDSLMTGLCLDNPNAPTHKEAVVSHISGGNRNLIWLLSGEHRHKTCISGGASGVISIAKLLQTFAPDIAGLSLAKTRCGAKSDGSWNFARSGAAARDIRHQVVDVITKLNKPENVQIKNGWKMIFLWCGGNDVLLDDWNGNLDQEATNRITRPVVEALQLLRSCVDRCFVALLTIPDISSILKHDATPRERDHCRRKLAAANRAIRRVVTDYDWEVAPGGQPSSFVVTIQATIESPIEHTLYQKHFASAADGAHPNALAHQAFAKCVWHNLFAQSDDKWTTMAQVLEGGWFVPSSSSTFR
ncbi:hypothetical protein DFS34DRAFT_632144 [Phlyctochytrium arcticum]|nr:hypothetical protein DFS34DRAFT_632144 [Phlyctochytrium arcticum]